MRTPHNNTRRKFITTSLGAGAAVALSGRSVEAIRFPSAHTIELGRQIAAIGELNYVQFHVDGVMDLETSAITVEMVTRDLALEKVASLGDAAFDGMPANVLSTLYYANGLRATITSAPVIQGRIGVLRGSTGSITITAKKMTVTNASGHVVDEPPIYLRTTSGGSATLPLILQALREEKTIFPGQ